MTEEFHAYDHPPRAYSKDPLPACFHIGRDDFRSIAWVIEVPGGLKHSLSQSIPINPQNLVTQMPVLAASKHLVDKVQGTGILAENHIFLLEFVVEQTSQTLTTCAPISKFSLTASMQSNSSWARAFSDQMMTEWMQAERVN